MSNKGDYSDDENEYEEEEEEEEEESIVWRTAVRDTPLRVYS